ncbi:hypothetical protein CIB48_g8256 [Xylaria polymorpha]|nr:hypothetical protein CIB48_g8256 [Xylaria polymorpha]
MGLPALLHYRGTYSDDAAWDRYMELFSVEWQLPDAARLAGEVFPTPNDASTRLPRFTYCLYVNQECLDTRKAYLDAKANGTPSVPYLVAVIIDGDLRYSSDRKGHDTPDVQRMAMFMTSVHIQVVSSRTLVYGRQ